MKVFVRSEGGAKMKVFSTLVTKNSQNGNIFCICKRGRILKVFVLSESGAEMKVFSTLVTQDRKPDVNTHAAGKWG